MQQQTLRERLANMSQAEIQEAWRATARGDEECRAAGLLDFADDREEVTRILLERLPELEAATTEILGQRQ